MPHAVDVGLHLDEVVVDQVVGAIGAALQIGDEALQPALENLVALLLRKMAERRVVIEPQRSIDLTVDRRGGRRTQVARRQHLPDAALLCAGRQAAGEPHPLDVGRVERPSRAEGGAAVEEGEGHAVERHPGEVDPAGGVHRHLEPHPAAGPRNRRDAPARGRTLDAPADATQAPVGAMFPARTGTPLQHQLGRRIVRIDVGPHEQALARRRREGAGGILEEMLVQPGHRRLGVAAAGGRAGAVDRQHRSGDLERRP